MNSLAEVEAYALSCVPVRTFNEMHGILKLQQNTLLNLLKTTAL